MNPNDTAFSRPAGNNIAGVDNLIVDGNVNYGKNKGQGQLLLTRTTVFAFRANNHAAMAGGAAGGMIGALIGHFIDKHRAKKQPPPEHLDDPEVQQLDESVLKKFARSSLLVKYPIDASLHVERTMMGVKLSRGNETPTIYQGLIHKSKINAFLVALGVDVR